MKSILVIFATLFIATAAKAEVAAVDRYKVSSTVSPEAAAALKPIYEKVKAGAASPTPHPVTLEEFDRYRAPGETEAARNLTKQAKSLNVKVSEEKIDGIPVLRIHPQNKKADDGGLLIYIHGGAYVMGSAKSTLFLPSKVATATGYEVLSIDYSLAPRSRWKQTTEEIVRVWKALLGRGEKPSSIGVFGDSAGGSLAAGSVLRMRDENLPLPGALYLMSPWADITLAGDTMETLAAADPLLPIGDFEWVAALYAAPADQKNPYVSPVYGDFSKGYPPTLIQAGTREILLSASVRLYQAIRGGGQDATLDVYEGLPHVFQGFVANSPEGVTATNRAAAFLAVHLKPSR